MLDSKDQDGQSIYSDDGDEYGEMGESELNDNESAALKQILEKLDPETRQRFENGELGEEELEQLGLINNDDSYGDENFGEDEQGEEESDEDGEEGYKRQKGDSDWSINGGVY